MDRQKAIGLFKLSLNKTLSVFNMYGMGEYIPEVVQKLVEAALVLHERLNEVK